MLSGAPGGGVGGAGGGFGGCLLDNPSGFASTFATILKPPKPPPGPPGPPDSTAV